MVRTMVATQGLGPLGHLGEQVGHEVGAASLPARSREHRCDSVLQPLVRVRGHQIHAAQAAAHQGAQEREPEGTVLAGAHVHAQDLALALGVDCGGHHDAHVDDASVLAHLLGQRVQPEIGVRTAVQGAAQERVHGCIQLLTDAGDLALGDAFAAQ